MTQAVETKLDGYDLKALYWPALIVVSPDLLAFAHWFPPGLAF